MGVRQILLRFAVVGALAALAFLAFTTFTTTTSTPSAEAVQPNCTFAVPIPALIQQGGGADTVTCNFSIRGHDHTLVVGFTLNLGGHPLLSINGCTLDSRVIHVGPCP